MDAEAARSGRATPATALKPDAARFPELEKTRAAVAEVVRDLKDFFPSCANSSSAGAPRRRRRRRRRRLAKNASFKKNARVASRAAIPAKLGYVTVALVEHLIELPDTAEGVPHDWVRVSTNKSKRAVRYHPPAVLAARGGA